MIDKSIISQRKAQYGNNFPKFAELLNNYFDTDMFTPENVAMMMALMKVSRLSHSPEHQDSLIDMENYIWIAQNYQEYLNMDVVKNKRDIFCSEDD